MTISTTTRLFLAHGNGATTVFPFGFEVPSASVFSVQIQDSVTGEILQILNPSDYVLSGVGNPAGGSVTYNPISGPLPTGKDIVGLRTMPYTQETEISNQGGFYPEAIEQQLDFIVMQIQQIAETLTRSLIVNPGQTPPNIQDLNELVQEADDAASAASASAAAAAISEANAAASEATVANVAAYLNTSEYNFSLSTSYPPASGEVRFSAGQDVATVAYLSHLNLRGVDLTNLIPLIVSAGSKMLFQDRDQPSKFVIYDVISNPTLVGSDFQIGISLKQNGGALTAEPIFVGFSGGGGSAVISVSDTPPPGPLQNGQAWFKSSTGAFYLYYDDGDTKQWVQVSTSPQLTSPTDPWVFQPIGVPIPVMTHKGASAPNNAGASRWIKLTASDSFNTGLLTGESVTGVAPLVVATATVSLLGSPLDGQTINLWNTERRHPRAGSAGTKQDDAMQGHWHNYIFVQIGSGLGAGTNYGTATNNTTSPISDGVNGTPRTANETRVKNEGVDYYMRIL